LGLGTIRLNALGTIDFNFELVNSLLNWQKIKKVDAVITRPSFQNEKIVNTNGVSNSPYREVEQFLLMKGRKLLNPMETSLYCFPMIFWSAQLNLT